MDGLLAIISPALGIVAAIVAGLFANRARVTEHRLGIQREEINKKLREQDRLAAFEEDVVRQIEEPLLYAASDLQSRIWNILEGGSIKSYARSDVERHRTNAVEYTTFLFAQYFGWSEAMRQAALMSEMAARGGRNTTTPVSAESSVAASLREINDALASDRYGHSFMIFSSEQHAIGELMLKWNDRDRLPSVDRYATFAARFRDSGSDFHQWFDAIVEGLDDVESVAARQRLVEVQNELVDLMGKIASGSQIYKKREKIAPLAAATKALKRTPKADYEG